jgi:acyl-CoA reductase-like NAD-dependent aldehyde dehydrogenase
MTLALESYLAGRWLRGEGVETVLTDPVTGAELATASATGLDLAAALDYARKHGQGALRSMGYAARAKLVGAVADVLVANRARYEEIAIANSGNTKADAAMPPHLRSGRARRCGDRSARRKAQGNESNHGGPGRAGGLRLEAHGSQSPAMATAVKPSQQPRTESCVMTGNGHYEA